MRLSQLSAVVVGVAAIMVATPAQASEDGWFPMRLASNVVCVQPDFTVTGSGYRVQQAVAEWNAVQTDVIWIVGQREGCSVVRMHRYSGSVEHCGWTNYDNWGPAWEGPGGVITYTSADVYLNDACGTLSRCFSMYLVAHELGHAAGLPHSSSRRSVMSYSYNCHVMRGTVGVADAAALHVLYGPDLS